MTATTFINHTATSNKRIFGATMMVTGCCIGAGMIGLPVMSALTGFMPSVVAMLFCYLFTTITGLLLAEATLWFDDNVNLPSIVEFALGKIGKVITMTLFLFLFYCLFVAFLDGGGNLFSDMLGYALHIPVRHDIGVLSCMIFVAAIAYAGARATDHVNRLLLAGLVLSYLTLVIVGLPHIHQENLLYTNWSAMFGVVPILLLCFGYQNLVPSLVNYLHKDAGAIRFAIIVGNLIPFFVYFFWDYLILSLLPPYHSATGNDTAMVIELLTAAAIPSVSIIFVVKSFSLFAMLTSFLPSAVSFVDFLKDGFKNVLHQKLKNDLPVFMLVFLPPAACALIYPKIFLNALSFAGGFIDVILFGILPALVVLIGRRMITAKSHYQVIGGTITPVIVVIISLVLLMLKMRGL